MADLDHYSITADILCLTARNLQSEFRLRKSPVKISQARRPVNSMTRGSSLHVASLPNVGVDIELWYDQILNRGEYIFWIGFSASKEADLSVLIAQAPLEARPNLRITSDDYETNEDGTYYIKRDISEDDLAKSLLEVYVDEKSSYYGRFFYQLDALVAADYIENVLSIKMVADGFYEGACGQITTNHYERDPKARRACIEKYGYICQICFVDFEKTYGLVGKDFIHVHHLDPLALRKGATQTTVDELVSVCPNCHAMLHRGSLKSPEALKKDMALVKQGILSE